MSKILEQLQTYQNLGLHSGYYDFLIETGISFTERTDYFTGKNLKTRKNQCYNNSIRALINCGLDYYEGFYWVDGLPLAFEHGFNRFEENDFVIDVTAQKYHIPVQEWFGVKIPYYVINEFLNSEYNGILTPLQYYWRFHVNKKVSTF